jgi:hypothetical protein
MLNRYGSKPLPVQENESMFYILNNALDPPWTPTYDPPVWRMYVHHIEHTGIEPRSFAP